MTLEKLGFVHLLFKIMSNFTFTVNEVDFSSRLFGVHLKRIDQVIDRARVISLCSLALLSQNRG